MKYVLLAIVAFVSACAEQTGGQYWVTRLSLHQADATKQVKVLGRTWTVAPIIDHEGVYVAERDNLDLNPFGAPVARRTPQAIRALESATGCKVIRSTLKQDTSARFYSSMNCG